jgi:hypothetical protein
MSPLITTSAPKASSVTWSTKPPDLAKSQANQSATALCSSFSTEMTVSGENLNVFPHEVNAAHNRNAWQILFNVFIFVSFYIHVSVLHVSSFPMQK